MRRLSRLRGIESCLSSTSILHYLYTETCMLSDSIVSNRLPWKKLYSNNIYSLHSILNMQKPDKAITGYYN